MLPDQSRPQGVPFGVHMNAICDVQLRPDVAILVKHGREDIDEVEAVIPFANTGQAAVGFTVAPGCLFAGGTGLDAEKIDNGSRKGFTPLADELAAGIEEVPFDAGLLANQVVIAFIYDNPPGFIAREEINKRIHIPHCGTAESTVEHRKWRKVLLKGIPHLDAGAADENDSFPVGKRFDILDRPMNKWLQVMVPGLFRTESKTIAGIFGIDGDTSFRCVRTSSQKRDGK